MNLIVKMKVVLCLSVADNIVCTMVIVIVHVMFMRKVYKLVTTVHS